MRNVKVVIATLAMAAAVSAPALARDHSPGDGPQNNSAGTAVYVPEGNSGYTPNTNTSADPNRAVVPTTLSEQDALILQLHQQLKAEQN